ncbi:hypothetical protein [Aminobacter sp. MDW-2]|uniref:hypothetical protein n=1 Tax=Aminobacter sp. MDW-2 TaxID=2666139 RepID=UPI0012AFD558|nr:hypothetical protein [Aminobacter sp. MDW-2]MRX33176.1 hypothetical protein [Aminobacter sp. MDW-2]QNH36802.1 hypothetical protein H5P29_13395 [Aminobacter sp. MDW-2]
MAGYLPVTEISRKLQNRPGGIIMMGWLRSNAMWVGLSALAVVAAIIIGGVDYFDLTETIDENCDSVVERLHPIRWLLQLAVRSGCALQSLSATIAMLGTALTAVFTGTLWWSTNRLWQASRDQLTAARDAISVSERLGEIQARAYVQFQHMDISTAYDGAGKQIFVFKPTFVNSGQTPALVRKTIVQTRIVEDGRPETLDWGHSLVGEDAQIALGSGIDVAVATLTVPLNDAKRLGPGYRLFYRFTVDYSTVFSADKTFRTEHAIEVVAEGNPSQAFAGARPSSVFSFAAQAKGTSMT